MFHPKPSWVSHCDTLYACVLLWKTMKLHQVNTPQSAIFSLSFGFEKKSTSRYCSFWTRSKPSSTCTWVQPYCKTPNIFTTKQYSTAHSQKLDHTQHRKYALQTAPFQHWGDRPQKISREEYSQRCSTKQTPDQVPVYQPPPCRRLLPERLALLPLCSLPFQLCWDTWLMSVFADYCCSYLGQVAVSTKRLTFPNTTCLPSSQ